MSTRNLTAADIAKCIDHSLLQPFLARDVVEAGIRAAAALHTASVCVRPCDVKLASSILDGTDVLVCTVIGFPHGSVTTDIKLREAQQALEEGAHELDVVIPVGHLKSGLDSYVQNELIQLQALAVSRNASVKVIFENAYLSHDEKIRAYRIAIAAGVAFLKTSTGYAPTGSTPEDLRLMRDVIAGEGATGRVAIKAAGGIRTLDTLLEALTCGATRVGASATADLVEAFKQRTAATGGMLTLPVEPSQPLIMTQNDKSEQSGPSANPGAAAAGGHGGQY